MFGVASVTPFFGQSTMKYLFLDDERDPADVTWVLIGDVGSWGASWHVVRSMQEACDWVTRHGFPDVISFDHDLGLMHYANDYSDGKTGLDFARWLIELDMDTGTMPAGFKFTVHSMNPVGAENITRLLQNYIRQK
jgi:CheY-like chemotaxis protein